jgi:hypothetical protein
LIPAHEPCALTIARSRHRRLAKLIRPDGITGYDSVLTIDLHPRPVADLAALYGLLKQLSPRSDCCILRGAPLDPARVRGVRRLLHPDPKTGEVPSLREVPRRWIALDLDGLPMPAGTDPRDLAACAHAVLPLLPVAFRDASLIVQATATHGIKPGARLRLWAWLSRPLSGAECKRWLRPAPVDPVVFRTVQPIYVAAPIFYAGAVDPLPQRLLLLPGQCETVEAPDAMALAPPPPRPATQPRPLPDRSRAGRYALAALSRAAAAITRGDGGRHMVAMREALSLARLVRGGLLSEAEVTRAIDGALRVPERNTAISEAADVVAWAMQHAAERPLPEGVRT